MTAKHTLTLLFQGRFDVDSFAEFARHRAARLSLDAAITALAPNRITVAVAGQPELLDAFEMACSLGPIDCLVEDVSRGSGRAA
jgi:acylphosphatase